MRPTPWIAAVVLASSMVGGAAWAAQPVQPVQPAQPARPAGQAPPAAATPGAAPMFTTDDNAERIRERLRTILRQYPPSVADVLRADSTLLTNAAYLAPYPELAAFIAQHQEILHNPGYYVGVSRNEWDGNRQPYNQSVSEMGSMFAGLLVFSGLVTFMGLIGWGVKTLVEHRRWLRQSKVQTDAHTKVLDRFASNEDLLAYIQTPAGQHFLQSAPIAMDTPKGFNAPVGRILFAAQAGVIAAFAGMGLLFISNRFVQNPNVSEMSPFFFTVGIVTMAIGAGFLVSSALAYLLSKRLGLLADLTSSHA